MTNYLPRKMNYYLIIILSIQFLCACGSKQNIKSNPDPSPKLPITRTNISDVQYGVPYRYKDFDGDIFNATWADDDNLYMYSNDARAIGGTSIDHHMILFGKLTGSDQQDLKGTLINSFEEYNSMDFNNHNWKSAGLISIDGTLYMTVMKHSSYTEAGVKYQVKDASIIKSTDYGKTWSRSFVSNRDNPMFTDKRFSSPWFIQYGKDYSGTDTENLASEYVYAISTDGRYDNGNYWYLGRVQKAKIGNLDAADWEFYKGDKSVASGRDNTNWSSNIALAKPIITDPGKVSKTGIQYVKGINKYVLIEWYYKPPYDISGDPNAASTSYWHLWQSDTPWGPWVKSDKRHVWTSEGLYCPVINPKSISSDGRDLTVFATGNWMQANSWGLRDDEDNPYTFWTVPVTLLENGDADNHVGVFKDGDSMSLENLRSKKIIAPESETKGALVKLFDTHDSGKWTLDYVGDGDRYYKIVNVKTGLCLQANGRNINLGSYRGANSQRWFIQYIGDGNYWLFPKSDSKKLLTYNADNPTKLSLSAHVFSNRDSQRWLLKK